MELKFVGEMFGGVIFFSYLIIVSTIVTHLKHKIMTNLQTPSEHKTTEENFQLIYDNLKKMPLEKLKKFIESHYDMYGDIFLDSMTTNSVLDIDLESNDIRLKHRIRQIERTCSRIYKREDINNTVAKTLKSVPAVLVTIGTFGYFVIELIRLISDLICHG